MESVNYRGTTCTSHPEYCVREAPKIPALEAPQFGCATCVEKRNEFTLYEFPLPAPDSFDRDKLLEQIKNSIEKCKSEKHPYRRLIVLHGFGGMGKSELAKVWAHKFHEEYNYVFWFDADSEPKLLQGFTTLADKLGVPFNDQEHLSTIYHALAAKCNRGVFIFDNAQRLTDHKGEFGIQPYLCFHILPRKPIVIVTSRRGDTFWGSLSDGIQRIHICFSEEESHCLDPRVYLPEWKGIVQTAFAPTVENMLLQTDGSLGKELLDIITFLGPDPILVELVNAIYNRLPNSSSLAYEDFSWSDLTTPVKKGLKLLQSYSLIEVTVTTRVETSYCCELNVHIISMHPFIQKRSLDLMRMTGNNTIEVVKVICKFFEQNERNENYWGQMKAVFEHLTTDQFGKDAFQNSVIMLCRLMLEGRLSEWSFAENLHRLQVCGDTHVYDEQVMFCGILRLVDFYVSQVVPGEASEEACTKAAATIYQLGDHFGSHPWIFFTCTYVLKQMLSSFSPMKENPAMRELADLMLCSWTKLLPRSYRYCPILSVLLFSSRNSNHYADFISEVVRVSNEDDRPEFCQDLNKLATFLNESEKGGLFIKFVFESIGEDLLTRLLTFKEKRSTIKFLKNFGAYLDCFNRIRTISSCSFTESRDLTTAVWKYTKFTLDLITTNPYNWNVETLKIWEASVSMVITVACHFLLNPDKPEFWKEDLVSQCQKWLKNITLRRKDLSVGLRVGTDGIIVPFVSDLIRSEVFRTDFDAIGSDRKIADKKLHAHRSDTFGSDGDIPRHLGISYDSSEY